MLMNMRIGSRILLALSLPVVGLIFFSGNAVLEKRKIANEMVALGELADLAPAVSAVVHELQKERGTSAVFIGSKGEKFNEQILIQHKDTDSKLNVMEAALNDFDRSGFGQDLSDKIDVGLDALSQLRSKRDDVKTFNLTVPQMAGYYTPTIAKLLSIVEEMAVISSNADVTKSIVAYTNYLQAKERAGQERAMGGAGFGAGKFSPPVYRRLVELISEQNVLLSRFSIYATPEQTQFHKSTVKGSDVDEVIRMRKIAVDSIYTGTTENIQGPYWFDTITKKIDLLKIVEDKISDDLVKQVITIQTQMNQAFYVFLTITVFLLVVTGVLVYLIVRGITRPLVGLTRTMGILAEGDTSVHISGTHRGDEIGPMSQAVQIFKDSMIHNQELAAQQEKENAAKEQKRVALENMAHDFEGNVTSVLGEVSTASDSMKTAAQGMVSTAEETSAQSSIVAAAAEEASANVQTVASAAEELSSSISEISNQVSHSATISATAVSEVKGANTQVQSLVEAANKIGEVVALITDIADQTNLLALNATIEAARAGEAGKGFAVVASEVKNLANQTAKATEDISNQIGGIQSATKNAVQAIGAIGGTINEMNEISSAIASAVEQQGAATREIARNVEEASTGTSEVTTNITHVNQAAKNTGNSANRVLDAVHTLSGESDKLSHYVKDFLNGLKSIE